MFTRYMKIGKSIIALLVLATTLTSCFGGKATTSSRGGELTGTGVARASLSLHLLV